MAGNGAGTQGAESPYGSDADALDISLTSLETFKKGVDGLLKDLEDSAAAPKRMGREKLKGAHLGTGFSEADSLLAAYNDVHDRLKRLSQGLADQIEAMSLTVHMAKTGYRNVDEEQSARLWAIRQHTQKFWDAAKNHEYGGHDGQDAGASQTPGQPQPDESTAGVNYS